MLVLVVYPFSNHHLFWTHRYQSSVAKSCLSTILSIQPKDSAVSGGETRENVVQRLADDMLDKLPPYYLRHEVRLLFTLILLLFSRTFNICTSARKNRFFIFRVHIIFLQSKCVEINKFKIKIKVTRQTSDTKWTMLN